MTVTLLNCAVSFFASSPWHDIYLPEFMNYSRISLCATTMHGRFVPGIARKASSCAAAAFNEMVQVRGGTNTNPKASTLPLHANTQMGATSPTHWWEEYAAHFTASRLKLCQRSCSKCGDYICFALAAYGKGTGLLSSGQALQWSINWVTCFHCRDEVPYGVLQWTPSTCTTYIKHETERSRWAYQPRRPRFPYAWLELK